MGCTIGWRDSTHRHEKAGLKMRCSVSWCVPALIMLSFGCGRSSEIEKVIVSGTVTRDGQPMPKGRITLFPVAGTNGPVSGAEIKEGVYKIDVNGGVPVGRHRVAFHEVEVDPKRDPTLPPPLVENNILPPRYNDQSKLEFEVESSRAPVTQDFDLDEEFGPLER
jgi:hypothetical protein